LTVDVDTCALCGAQRYRPRFRDEPYEVRECCACGLVWVSPRLEEGELVGIYAAEGYWRSPSPKEQGYADYRGDEALYLRTFRRRLERALRGGPAGGRALDVGCAAGFCMQVLAERGFDVRGVEVSPTIAATAQARFGADAVHVGTLDTAPSEPGTFDLVTLWDVVEHVPDPRALLVRALQLLAPGGLLVLETQNVASAFARALGPRWHHYKHAEHLYHFTPPTIRRLLEQSGLRVEAITSRDAGKWVSLDFVAERSARLHPALSSALAPLARLGRGRGVYVNVHDEMIVTARAAES
jgi:SAM-dependent methyltransferase